MQSNNWRRDCSLTLEEPYGKSVLESTRGYNNNFWSLDLNTSALRLCTFSRCFFSACWNFSSINLAFDFLSAVSFILLQTLFIRSAKESQIYFFFFFLGQLFCYINQLAGPVCSSPPWSAHAPLRCCLAVGEKSRKHTSGLQAFSKSIIAHPLCSCRIL